MEVPGKSNYEINTEVSDVLEMLWHEKRQEQIFTQQTNWRVIIYNNYVIV